MSTGRRRDALATPVSTSGLFNLPNILTMLRLVLVVPFVVALMWDGGNSTTARLVATVLFIVASVTDYIDGYLARQRNLVTTFGKIADPIADKLLTGAALICLSLLGQLPWWVTGLILFREIGVTLLRFWVINRGVIAASPGGKLKTALQIAAIVLYLLPLTGPAATFAQIVMGAAVILTLITGVDYLIRVLRLREESTA